VSVADLNTHIRDNENYLFAADYLALLKANSGTSTAAGATNVDTVSITGLTAKDSLIVEMTIASVTQQTTAGGNLYNNTDGVNIVSCGNIAAGTTIQAIGTMRQAQSGATKVMGYIQGVDQGAAAILNGNLATFTTNWTGSWTLAFRHGGVTAGGTYQWAWAVYKLVGQ